MSPADLFDLSLVIANGCTLTAIGIAAWAQHLGEKRTAAELRRAHVRLDNHERQIKAMGRDIGWADDRAYTRALTGPQPPLSPPAGACPTGGCAQSGQHLTASGSSSAQRARE